MPWKDLWATYLDISHARIRYNFHHDGTDELSFISQMRSFSLGDPASATQVYILHLHSV